MTPPLEIRRAWRAATSLHDRFYIRDAADIDVRGIAALLGVEVRDGGVEGAAARLIGDDRWAVIRLSGRVEHDGARNFSVAHELGHHQLSHPPATVAALCSSPKPRERVDRSVEASANAFAAELLMPARLLRRRCEVSPVSLDPARAIALEFKVSLMAAALRFVELTSERCALVFSRDRRVVWAARSETFAPEIPRGKLLDRQSVAADWFDGGKMYEGCQPVPGDAWIDHSAAAGIEVWEDSLAVPGVPGVMSLVWLPDSLAAPFDRG